MNQFILLEDRKEKICANCVYSSICAWHSGNNVMFASVCHCKIRKALVFGTGSKGCKHFELKRVSQAVK